MFPESVKEQARGRSASLVLPEGEDERIDEAAGTLVSEDIADRVVVIGGSGEYEHPGVERVVPEEYPRRSDVENLLGQKLDEVSPEELRELSLDPLYVGAAMVELDEVNGMVAGAAHPTAEVLRAALSCLGTRPGEDVVSSSFVMELEGEAFGSDGRLIFSDPAVLPNPDPEQLVDVAAGAVRTYENLLGDDDPRVAFLSFSTRGSAQHEDVDKVRSAFEAFNQKHPEVTADGELQADAALVPSVAERKAPSSDVNGEANVLVFPDLDAANIGYKLVQWLGDAGAYGPFLQGLDGVVNDLSRGCSVDDILTVCAVSVIQGTP